MIIENNTITINFTKKFFVELQTEWSQLFGKYNWYSFTFIKFYLEKDDFTHAYVLEITLLGFSAYFRYNTEKTLRLFEKWDKEVFGLVNKGKSNLRIGAVGDITWDEPKKKSKKAKKVASKKSKSK